MRIKAGCSRQKTIDRPVQAIFLNQAPRNSVRLDCCIQRSICRWMTRWRCLFRRSFPRCFVVGVRCSFKFFRAARERPTLPPAFSRSIPWAQTTALAHAREGQAACFRDLPIEGTFPARKPSALFADHSNPVQTIIATQQDIPLMYGHFSFNDHASDPFEAHLMY
jgi:hypothetical protein